MRFLILLSFNKFKFSALTAPIYQSVEESLLQEKTRKSNLNFVQNSIVCHPIIYRSVYMYIQYHVILSRGYITAIYITLSGLFGKELYKYICFRSNHLHVHNIELHLLV